MARGNAVSLYPVQPSSMRGKIEDLKSRLYSGCPLGLWVRDEEKGERKIMAAVEKTYSHVVLMRYKSKSGHSCKLCMDYFKLLKSLRG